MSAPTLKRILIAVVVAGVAVAAILVALFGEGSGGTPAPVGQVWTCSMHPQVRLPRSGKCPICSMPLILTQSAAPAANEGGAVKPAVALVLSEQARAMASVETLPIERRPITHEIRAFGKVQYNESALAVISSRVEGYIERLFVDFTGVQVKKGDHLVEIYSPDLVLAQRELLVGLEGPANQALVEASKLKLLRWGLTQEQIDDLVQNRKVSERVTLYSPIDGTVTERLAVEQAMVKSGEMLYQLANLDSVWVYLDIFESELGWVQAGQTVEIGAEAYPGEAFPGRIWFINPVLTEESRTVKVLVTIANTDQKLKPGMFASASIKVPVLADGSAAPTGLGGQFTCPMHPHVLKPKTGACPHCGMDLRAIPGAVTKPAEADLNVLAVPVSAVLDSGTRKVVYVERSRGEFMPVEVNLGPRAGDYFPILEGLQEGDKVAIRGGFLLDSQFQIQGFPSLFYGTGQAPAAGHQHDNPPGASATTPAPGPDSSAPPGHEGHTAPKPAESKR
jgi:membrane fusion protein, copper/silver efflux system